MSDCNEQCRMGKKVACQCNQTFCFKHPRSHLNVCQYSGMIYINAKKSHLEGIEARIIDALEYIYTQIDIVSSDLFNQIKILKQNLETSSFTVRQGYTLELNAIGKFDVEEFDPIAVKYNTENLCASFITKGTALKLNENQQIIKKFEGNKTYCGSPVDDRLTGLFEVSSPVYQYTGHLVDGSNHGLGYINVKNEFSYIGGWFKGKKDGYGVCEWFENCGNSQHWYKGNFFNDLMHGYGEYYYSDGSKYSGQWCLGKMHGQGKKIYSDCRIYTGIFENNTMNGIGKKEYPNGEIYEGMLKNDLRNGNGKLIKANGRVYIGTFLDNRMIGKFAVHLPNNEGLYTGPIVNEMLNGVGTHRLQKVNFDMQVTFFNDEIYSRNI